MARAAESEAAKIRAGLIDPFKVHRNRPIDDHLTDYLGFLRSEGSTAKHVSTTGARIRTMLAGTGAKRLSDLDAIRVSDWLARQRKGGMSAQTSNHYLQRIRSSSLWLVRHGRMPSNPLAPLAPVNVKTDRRHDRRVLTQEEFDALIRATRSAEPFRGLSGDDRAMLYLVATYTGLRAAELASLTPAGFDLDADQPTVRVRAGYTKNGEEAVVPLRPDLREQLRSYLSGRAVHAPVWPRSWVNRSAEMLRADLKRVGIPYVDSNGRYRDFHALRHRFGSELARANVPPKVAQTLMRHSTITLTMDHYSHVGLYDTAGALDKLPPLPGRGDPTEAAAARATGTDGRPISERLSLHFPYEGDGTGRELVGCWRNDPR
jgi:integrase